MDKYAETFATWNNIATVYQDKFMKMVLYNDSYDYLCTFISKPNAKLLDVGCGPGNITQYLLSKRPDFDIMGIDIAPNMIELARKNNPGANFTLMDSRNIGSLNSQYDAVVAGFCLPYLSSSETKDFIFSAYNLLHKNGLIYLSFVGGEPEQSGFKTGSGGRVFFHYHDLNEVSNLLAAVGFCDLKTFNINYKISETEFEIHSVFIAQKKAKKQIL